MNGPTLRIGIVAGEPSGDTLGAALIEAVRARLPEVEFEGIGGPKMKAAGCRSLFPMERLAVMGITEVLGRYIELRGIRRRLAAHFTANPPALFIGIDAPDFNLGLEERIRKAGVPTLHYVCPTVWAWRSWRVRQLRRAADEVLALFPFETAFLRNYGVASTFVGHPLADTIQPVSDQIPLRRGMRFPEDRPIVALLPGSRVSELKAHADLFVRTAQWLLAKDSNIHFVAPFVSRETRLVFEEAVKRCGAWDLPLTRMFGHARDAMASADVVLLASGTATLEALFLRRPMVVTYRLSWLTGLLVRLVSRVKRYSLPNNLAGREIVPELLQRRARPELLGEAVLRYLREPALARVVQDDFGVIHEALRGNAAERAAEVVVKYLRRRGVRVPG